jgi:hypothetical protein
MDREDGTRTGCDGALYLTYINGAGVWLDVHEDRPSADIRNSPGGRDKGHGDRNDLITRANTTRDKRQVQGTRTRVDANAVANATISRKLSFKR